MIIGISSLTGLAIGQIDQKSETNPTREPVIKREVPFSLKDLKVPEKPDYTPKLPKGRPELFNYETINRTEIPISDLILEEVSISLNATYAKRFVAELRHKNSEPENVYVPFPNGEKERLVIKKIQEMVPGILVVSGNLSGDDFSVFSYSYVDGYETMQIYQAGRGYYRIYNVEEADYVMQKIDTSACATCELIEN